MAVPDIARDDLDEMLREEAEDVFYEDGRFTRGQAHVWAYRRAAQGQTGGVRMIVEGKEGGVVSVHVGC